MSLTNYTPDGLRLAFGSGADIEHLERSHRLLHRLDHVDFHRGGRRTELPEPARAHQDSRLKRTNGAVEGLHRAREIAAELNPVPAEVRDALVELGAQFADLLGIHGDRFLPPAIGDGAQ